MFMPGLWSGPLTSVNHAGRVGSSWLESLSQPSSARISGSSLALFPPRQETSTPPLAPFLPFHTPPGGPTSFHLPCPLSTGLVPGVVPAAANHTRVAVGRYLGSPVSILSAVSRHHRPAGARPSYCPLQVVSVNRPSATNQETTRPVSAA